MGESARVFAVRLIVAGVVCSLGCTPGPGGGKGGRGGASGAAGMTGSGGAGGSPGTGGGGAPGFGGSGGAVTGGTGGGSGGMTGTGGSGGNAGGSGGGSGGSAGRDAGAGGTGGRDAGAGGAGGGGTGGRDASATGGTGGGVGGSGGAGAASFSFFVVSMKALQTLSKNPEGFGGNLTFGQANGLAGADEICRQAAEMGMAGAGAKKWRALLSAQRGPDGMPVHARDRIGPGPWYDRNGKLVSQTLADLFSGNRPRGDATIINNLPNERGEPNRQVGPNGYTAGMNYDNHDTLTGSDAMGRLRATGAGDTCNDWTSTTVSGRPVIGHTWPRTANSGLHWLSDHTVPGCQPGIDRTVGGPDNNRPCVGCSGGYGGFYCFALP
jgi:hypothetical protein